MNDPLESSVEQLLEEVATVSPSAVSFKLWIPDRLTLAGMPISASDAFRIINHRVLQISEDFVPTGFAVSSVGKTHYFEKWSEPESAIE